MLGAQKILRICCAYLYRGMARRETQKFHEVPSLESYIYTRAVIRCRGFRTTFFGFFWGGVSEWRRNVILVFETMRILCTYNLNVGHYCL